MRYQVVNTEHIICYESYNLERALKRAHRIAERIRNTEDNPVIILDGRVPSILVYVDPYIGVSVFRKKVVEYEKGT